MKSVLFCVFLLISYTLAQQCLDRPVAQCFQSTCGYKTPIMTRNNTGCHPCTQDDIGARFTTCSQNFKSLFHFWKPPATCVSTPGDAGSVLPAPVHEFPCDFYCHAGEYIDVATKSCKKCGSGTWATGEDVVFDNWASVPPQFRTYCTSSSGPYSPCNSWRMQGSYADSGDNARFLGVRSVLELTVEVVQADSQIIFDYQYVTDDEAETFTFEANGKVVAEFSRTNSTEEWTTFTYKLDPGFYIFEWSIHTENNFVTSNLASVKRIVVDGLANAATTCTACPAGQYSDGTAPCKACPLNTFSNHTGASSCTACPDFYITESLGSTSCIPDPFAICVASDYFDDASDCINGQRTINTKLIKPVLCKPNHPDSYRPAQATRTEACVAPACQLGQYKDAQGVCQYCAKGYFINETYSSCQACPFGSGTANIFHLNKFDDSTSSLIRTGCFGACRSGGWRMVGDHMDSGEGNGYARTFFQMDLVIESTSPKVTVEYILSCPTEGGIGLGFIAGGSLLHFAACEGCSTTKRNVTLDLSHLVQTHTKVAFGGIYVTNIPTWDNFACDSAKITSINVEGTELGGADACVNCPAGTHADEDSNCDACAPGTFSKEGAYNCSVCPAGTFSVEGSSDCVKCKEGTVAPYPGSKTCVYAAGSNSFKGSLAGYDRTYNWNKTAQYTEKQVYSITGEFNRYFLNLRRDPASPHAICGNAIACQQANQFVEALSLGDSVAVSTYITSSEAGLVMAATSAKPTCNNGRNFTTTTIKLICNPQITTPAVVFEKTNNTECNYSITITSQEACPACVTDDYYLYRGQCLSGLQTNQYIRRLEPSHLCFGGHQEDLNPKTVECNPFTVYVEGPVWALVIVLLVILILLIVIAAAVVTAVVLIVKNRQLYSRLNETEGAQPATRN